MRREQSDFDFPKIHFLEYLAEHISGYGYLGQYSTEISERTHKKHVKEGWRKSNYVDAMAQILRYGDDYRSMMKVKVQIELAKPEPCLKEYPRFCCKKVNRYRDITSLSEQIEVPQLQTLLGRYLNLEGIVHRCHIQVWKSLDIKVELMPSQEYQVESIQRIQCTVKEALPKIYLERKDTVWVKQLMLWRRQGN